MYNYLFMAGPGSHFFLDLEISQMPVPILLVRAGAAPMLATLVLVYTSPYRWKRADFWQRLYDMERIRTPYLRVCLLTAPALTIMAGVLDRLLSGRGLVGRGRVLASLAALLITAIYLYFFDPLPEEMGWLRSALDALQIRLRPFKSSLLLGRPVGAAAPAAILYMGAIRAGCWEANPGCPIPVKYPFADLPDDLNIQMR